MKDTILIFIITLIIIGIMIIATFYFLFYGPNRFTNLGQAVSVSPVLNSYSSF